jgi:hypothetical protein
MLQTSLETMRRSCIYESAAHNVHIEDLDWVQPNASAHLGCGGMQVH